MPVKPSIARRVVVFFVSMYTSTMQRFHITLVLVFINVVFYFGGFGTSTAIVSSTHATCSMFQEPYDPNTHCLVWKSGVMLAQGDVGVCQNECERDLFRVHTASGLVKGAETPGRMLQEGSLGHRSRPSACRKVDIGGNTYIWGAPSGCGFDGRTSCSDCGPIPFSQWYVVELRG